MARKNSVLSSFGSIILSQEDESNFVPLTDTWSTEFRIRRHFFLGPPHNYSLSRTIAHDLRQKIVDNDDDDNEINKGEEEACLVPKKKIFVP